MAHDSLHNDLHGKNKALKEKLDWVKRVTIAVQAAREIEYLHGYMKKKRESNYYKIEIWSDTLNKFSVNEIIYFYGK